MGLMEGQKSPEDGVSNEFTPPHSSFADASVSKKEVRAAKTKKPLLLSICWELPPCRSVLGA